MKYFDDPRAEVVLFALEDIVTASKPDCEGEGDSEATEPTGG